MQFTLPFIALSALASVVVADSESFGLLVIRSGSQYQYSGITEKDNTFQVGGTSNYVEGVITDDGEFKLSNGKYAQVKSDGSIVASDEGSKPFSIEDSYLAYKGSQSFGVDTSNYDLLYNTGSGGLALRATSKGGSPVQDFSPSGSSSGSSSSASSGSSSAAVSSAPQITSTAQVVSNSTTLITITSCESDKCTEVPVTTGLTVVTSTKDNTITEYTTYCPISTKSVAPTSSFGNVTTPASVSTYEGSAAKAVPAFAALAAGVALLF